MAADGEDWNWLEITILKSLAMFFKIHQRWRPSPFDHGKAGLTRYTKYSVLPYLFTFKEKNQKVDLLVFGHYNIQKTESSFFVNYFTFYYYVV